MCVVFAADRLTMSRRRADGTPQGKDAMRFRHFFTFVLGIVFALTLVPAAHAANLFIDDSVEAEITLNHDANWEFGVLSNGTPFPARVAGSTTAPGEVATFAGSWIVNSAGNPDPGTGIIYFVDQAAKKHSCKRGGRRHHGYRLHGARRHNGHRRSVCVSDIVTANWITVAGEATISFTVVSSACGRNLGPLPRHFAGLGVADPASPIEIGGLFRNLVTAATVAIPSNLTVQFVGNADTACKSDDDDRDDHYKSDDDDRDDHYKNDDDNRDDPYKSDD
jgi:hypothetical protein